MSVLEVKADSYVGDVTLTDMTVFLNSSSSAATEDHLEQRKVMRGDYVRGFHMLARWCTKSFQLGFNSMWTENFQMYKLYLEKAEEPEIKLPTSIWSQKKQGKKIFFQKKIICFIDYAKSFHCGVTTNCKLHREGNTQKWEYQTTLPTSWETCMQVKKQQNWTWNNGLVPNWERSMSRLYIVTMPN